MSVDWSLDEIIQANRKNARESKMEQRSHKRKVFAKPYSAPVPKGNIGGKWEHDLYQTETRPKAIYVDTRALKQLKDVQQRRRVERREVNFLDSLDDDTDFQRAPVSRRELQGLDNDLDLYMERNVPVIIKEIAPKGRRYAREATLEHNFRMQKVISERYIEPKQKRNIGRKLDDFVDVSVHSRLSYPESRKPTAGIKKHKKESGKEFSNFLDRLADDREFQREQKEKREKQDLDNELDAYMKRSKPHH